MRLKNDLHFLAKFSNKGYNKILAKIDIAKAFEMNLPFITTLLIKSPLQKLQNSFKCPFSCIIATPPRPLIKILRTLSILINNELN